MITAACGLLRENWLVHTDPNAGNLRIVQPRNRRLWTTGSSIYRGLVRQEAVRQSFSTALIARMIVCTRGYVIFVLYMVISAQCLKRSGFSWRLGDNSFSKRSFDLLP